MNWFAWERKGSAASTPSLWKCSSSVAPWSSGRSKDMGGVLSLFFPSKSCRRRWSRESSTSSGGAGEGFGGNIWE